MTERPELITTRGLPGSGKTTWARGWVAEAPESRVRLNRDEMRHMLHPHYAGLLSRDLENRLTSIQQQTARTFLRKGVSVVVDDTNLRLQYAREWAQVAEQCGAKFIVNDDFLLTPLDTCIENDRERGESLFPGRYVGEAVIRGIWERYLMGGRLQAVTPKDSVTFAPYVPDTRLPKAWLTDLDGTLCIKGDRDIYDGSRCYLDTVNRPVADMIESAAYFLDTHIIYMTGRDEKYREVTKTWLGMNDLPPGELIMRPAGDVRDDAVVKNELFEEYVAPSYNVIGVFDDRDRVVKMWREKGIFCAQVNYGDF